MVDLRSLYGLALLLLSSIVLGWSQPGHGDHGAFKLEAYRLPPEDGHHGLHIPIQTECEKTQGWFNRGLEYLIGGEDEMASLSFRIALHFDSECAMAWWGLGMAWRERPGEALLYLKEASHKLGIHELEERWIRPQHRIFISAARHDRLDAQARKLLIRHFESLIEDEVMGPLAEAFYLLMTVEAETPLPGLSIRRHTALLHERESRLPVSYLWARARGGEGQFPLSVAEKISPAIAIARADTEPPILAARQHLEAINRLYKLRASLRLPVDGGPRLQQRIEEIFEFCREFGSSQDWVHIQNYLSLLPRRPIHAAFDQPERGLHLADQMVVSRIEQDESLLPSPKRGASQPARLNLHRIFPDAQIAPSWSAIDYRGRSLTSQDLDGQAYLAVFFLGSGCLLCMEQMQTLLSRAQAFEELGVQLLGFSTDPQEALALNLEGRDDNALPIRLLAGQDLAAFKSFGAWDEFRDEALHGLFLVDAEGRILWWEIGPHPFEDLDFLLGETGRLLEAWKIHGPVRDGGPKRLLRVTQSDL